MSSSINKYDALESVIFQNGLRILGVHLYPEINMILVVLNNRKVLNVAIDRYERLAKANKEELEYFELIGKGAAIHWPTIDEDISLKGLLKQELSGTATGGNPEPQSL